MRAMSRTPGTAFGVAATVAMLAVSIGTASAETFYNQDGVQLSATARPIDPGAATCRIREERHSAEEYERLKPNDGQPLDVWRVELVVANYSGKVLDYLSAHLNVESDWPPCDHWDGPERSYGAPVVWTGPLMSIQDVGSVEPGEERREIEFVLVFHEDEPALGRWDIDYDFAAATASAPGGGAPPAEPLAVPAADQAPGERTAEAPGAGRSGLPASIRADQTCFRKSVGEECWMEIENKPGCYLWSDELRLNETVTWSGGCADGLAHGRGEADWNYTLGGEQPETTASGEMRRGKSHGRWTARLSSGGVIEEAHFVDGLPHGRWTFRFANGSVYEGSYVDDKRHGRWTRRDADGNVSYTCYSNDAIVDC